MGYACWDFWDPPRSPIEPRRSGPGYCWPAFSADGTQIAWEVRYQSETHLDTVRTLWVGQWQGGAIANARAVGPGRRSAWRDVAAGGGSPAPLSAAFMSFPGSWSWDGAQYVYARLMRTYEITGNPTLSVEESRLWIRTLASGTDRQLIF